MTFVQILTVCFSTGNAVGMILAVRKHPAGWVVTAFAQLSMGVYLITTKQWFGIAQFVCLAIALWGLWTWTRKDSDDPVPSDREDLP